MKSFTLCVLVAAGIFAYEHNTQELKEIPRGTSITFNKNFVIPAGNTHTSVGKCEMSYAPSESNRELTPAHTLVLTKAEVVNFRSNVPMDCKVTDDQSDCVYQTTDAADYELTFEVYNEGKKLAALPVMIKCEGQLGTAQESIVEFKHDLEKLEFSEVKTRELATFEQ